MYTLYNLRRKESYQQYKLVLMGWNCSHHLPNMPDPLHNDCSKRRELCNQCQTKYSGLRSALYFNHKACSVLFGCANSRFIKNGLLSVIISRIKVHSGR